MNRIVLSILLLLTFFITYGQSNQYAISSYQDVYEPLDSFTSMYLEIGAGHENWEVRFDFGFGFPFFNRSYDYINADCGSYFSFDDTDYDIELFSFVGYRPDVVSSWPTELDSDVRYAYTTVGEHKAFVIEFLKNRLDNDPSVEEYDSYVNFQVWFFENGSMEVRFGDINLDHSPSYVPGEGFYLITSNGNYLSGPGFEIDNPDDPDDGIGLLGAYNNFDTISESSLLTHVPPPGWVMRFNRLTVNTTDTYEKDIFIFPNPVDDHYFFFEAEDKVEKIELFDTFGKKVLAIKEPENSVNIQSLEKGTYYLRFEVNNKFITEKLICK